MAKAQLKVLLFLVVLGITLGCMAIAYYIYDKVLTPDTRIQKELVTIKKSAKPLADPGLKRFNAAIDFIKEGKIEDGREALYRLIQQFPSSPTCIEARRIIGEINLDTLFSPNYKIGKRDYIVQPGDSLAFIATKQGTSVDMIIRLNGLVGTTLQPGDHLTLVTLDFSVSVDVSARTVTLLRKIADKEYFFKEYNATELALPTSLRPPAEMEIGAKSATADGKAVISTDPRYIDAEKWLPGTKNGIIIRSRQPVRTTPVAPTPSTALADKKSPASPKSASPTKSAPLPFASEPITELPVRETGIFLEREDLEELFALVRKGSKLYFVR
jgi:LysM repeat protein